MMSKPLQMLLAKVLPGSFAQMLLRGVSLDTILGEDDAKGHEVQNWEEKLRKPAEEFGNLLARY